MKNFIKIVTLILLVTGSAAYAMEQKEFKTSERDSADSNNEVQEVKRSVAADSGADINACDKDGETVLYRKINELQHIEDAKTFHKIVNEIDALLKQKPNTEIPSKRYAGQTALFSAVAINKIIQDRPHSADLWSIVVLQNLLKAGAKINATESKCRRTPMHTAAEGATLQAVKVLVQKLRDTDNLKLLNQEDKYKRTPIKFAQEAAAKGVDRKDVIDYLSDVMAAMISEDQDAVNNAVDQE